jgi:signal transduction histidine kinase
LEEEAVAVGNGDFGRMEQPVGGIAEIRQLQAELAELARKVRSAQQSLRSYIGAITRGQEDERRRLARELHDDTLQALIALNQRVQMLRYAKGAEQQQAQIADLQSLLDSTMKDLRRLTGALRPTYLEELGLVTALEMLARESGQGGRAKVQLTRQGREMRLPPEVELAFYRIAQEGVNNALRHANPVRVRVSISFAPEEVLLQIEDDGQGFTPPETPGAFAAQGHFGLLGMTERAELIQAELQIESSPGQGTHIRLRWRP